MGKAVIIAILGKGVVVFGSGKPLPNTTSSPQSEATANKVEMHSPLTDSLKIRPFSIFLWIIKGMDVQFAKQFGRDAQMDELKLRILTDGKNLGSGILKVDGFINHQVDPKLMDACGRELARRFEKVGATKVLTAEISGIAPALCTGFHLGLPVVYARKSKPITMPDQIFLTLAPSHTKGRIVELIVSPEYLGKNERILIIDDFLASGQTIMGLVRLTHAAGSEVVGIGAVIEKRFEEGYKVFSDLNVPIESLATIADMSKGKIVFAD